MRFGLCLGAGLPLVVLAASLGQASAPSAPSSAPASAPAALDAKWSDLLTRLAADDFKTREAAQKELSGLSNTLRPFVERLAETTGDPEAKSRLLARVAEMDEELALNPAPVSLDLKDATLREALDQLSQQTGLRIRGWPDWGNNNPNGELNKKVTVKIDNQPLWAALRDISKQRPMTPMHPSDGADVQVQVGNDGMSGAGVACGPALVILQDLIRQYRVTPGDKPADAKMQSNFDAHLNVMIDPRVQIAYAPGAGSVSISQALDDKGNSLLPAEGKSTAAIWWQPGGQANLALPLHYPGNPGTNITVLKGALTYSAVVRSRRVDLQLPGGAPVVGAHLEGLTITFKKFTLNGDNAEAAVKIERGSMDAAAWKKMVPDHSNHTMLLELLDAGNAAARSEGYGGSSNGSVMDFQFDFSLNKGEGAKLAPALLRVTIPTKIMEVSAPFEFHDIPLP